MATRDIILELIENEEFFLIWSRVDFEMEVNEEIIMVWDDNDTYRG